MVKICRSIWAVSLSVYELKGDVICVHRWHWCVYLANFSLQWTTLGLKGACTGLFQVQPASWRGIFIFHSKTGEGEAKLQHKPVCSAAAWSVLIEAFRELHVMLKNYQSLKAVIQSSHLSWSKPLKKNVARNICLAWFLLFIWPQSILQSELMICCINR